MCSCYLVDSSSVALSRTRRFERETVAGSAGDGDGHDGCSDGASAAGGGSREGEKDAGGFTAQFEQGEEIWRGWCGRSSW